MNQAVSRSFLVFLSRSGKAFTPRGPAFTSRFANHFLPSTLPIGYSFLPMRTQELPVTFCLWQKAILFDVMMTSAYYFRLLHRFTLVYTCWIAFQMLLHLLLINTSFDTWIKHFCMFIFDQDANGVTRLNFKTLTHVWWLWRLDDRHTLRENSSGNG